MAKNGLAGIYYFGAGVKQDKKKARKLWQEACKQGLQQSCELLIEYK